jgi:hypothetical protein
MRYAAAARDRYLKKLAKREPDDLRELGKRKGRREDVIRRIRALRQAQSTKPSFLERLRRAGF